MHQLNKVILDHLEMTGLTKVVKLMREELSKPPGADSKGGKHGGLQSAKG